MTKEKHGQGLGQVLKHRRQMALLTLRELAEKSGISPSHLVRIEKGERYPSATILQKIAQPLGFEENEILQLAGYLSYSPEKTAEEAPNTTGRIDPYVYSYLSKEPVEIQQSVIGILGILKSLSKAVR